MWICTDSDNAQYCLRSEENPDEFTLMEVRPFGKRKYAVVRGIVDTSDYSAHEMEEICKAYYDSLFEIVDSYGWYSAAQIIAECIFEGMPTSDMSVLSCWPSESAAHTAIAAVCAQIEKQADE